MSPQQEQFERVGAVFAAVRALPPGERQAALEAACGGDLGLHAEVRSLLAQDLCDAGTGGARAADSFLAAPALGGGFHAGAALAGATPHTTPRDSDTLVCPAAPGSDAATIAPDSPRRTTSGYETGATEPSDG